VSQFGGELLLGLCEFAQCLGMGVPVNGIEGSVVPTILFYGAGLDAACRRRQARWLVIVASSMLMSILEAGMNGTRLEEG
jgi:hypothetical protein